MSNEEAIDQIECLYKEWYKTKEAFKMAIDALSLTHDQYKYKQTDCEKCHESLCGGELIVHVPGEMSIKCKINYCPMCGRKLLPNE